MQFEYTGRHIEVTPALRAHVEDHFKKLEHIFNHDKPARAHVIMDVEKNRQKGEIVLHWREHTLTAAATQNDLYQALTQAIGKIAKQAAKLKDKTIDRRQNAQSVAVTAAAIAVANNSAVADLPPARRAAGEPRIINARRYAVKPMSPEEAAMQLTVEADQFLVYRDAQSDRVSVLYKRKDGNFGLIQP